LKEKPVEVGATPLAVTQWRLSNPDGCMSLGMVQTVIEGKRSWRRRFPTTPLMLPDAAYHSGTSREDSFGVLRLNSFANLLNMAAGYAACRQNKQKLLSDLALLPTGNTAFSRLRLKCLNLV
jgi:hypothetical protein